MASEACEVLRWELIVGLGRVRSHAAQAFSVLDIAMRGRWRHPRAVHVWLRWHVNRFRWYGDRREVDGLPWLRGALAVEACKRNVQSTSGGYLGVAIADFGLALETLLPESAEADTRRNRSSRFDTAPSPAAVIERIGAKVAHAGAAPLAGVGVAVWGAVDAAAGTIRDAHFAPEWMGYPFTERLAERLSAPVRLATGVSAAARAEADLAPGRWPLLYVHIGRTVASALVVGGRAVVGAHSDEGRLEHWQTGLDGPRCVCGVEGHLGPLVAAQSLIRLAIGIAAHDDATLAAINRVTHGRPEVLTAPQFIALAKGGAQPLLELAYYAAEALARALANLYVTLDPAEIVIGGVFAQVDPIYYDWLRERLDLRLEGVSGRPEIRAARAGTRAALIGAAALAAD